MSGIDLKELDASDMLDIIHYFFEEDLKVASGEQMDAINEVRKVVYEEFYLTKYFLAKTSSKYSTPNASGNFSEESFEKITPFDPNIKNFSKGYKPPTKFDPESTKPFGDILDGPVN
jgi:glutaredoxin 2